MSAKWQKFKVQIPSNYNPVERESIAQDIIDFIVERSKAGKDKANRAFKPGYSEGYAKTRVGQLAGKKKGATPNMTLSGEMLEALGDYLTHKPGELNIGFTKGTEENAKADGNVRGTYGNKSPVTTGRDFMGITNKDLNIILANYPIDDPEKRFESLAINAQSKAAATSMASDFARKHDLDISELMEFVQEKYK